MPPEHGKVLIGIQESFQSEFLPTANKLHQLGYQVCDFLQWDPAWVTLSFQIPGWLIHEEHINAKPSPPYLDNKKWITISYWIHKAEIQYWQYFLFTQYLAHIVKSFLNR